MFRLRIDADSALLSVRSAVIHAVHLVPNHWTHRREPALKLTVRLLQVHADDPLLVVRSDCQFRVASHIGLSRRVWQHRRPEVSAS